MAERHGERDVEPSDAELDKRAARLRWEGVGDPELTTKNAGRLVEAVFGGVVRDPDGGVEEVDITIGYDGTGEIDLTEGND